MIDDNIGNALSKGFCDIIEVGHQDTQRIVDILNSQALSAKDQRILQLEQDKQTADIINALKK